MSIRVWSCSALVVVLALAAARPAAAVSVVEPIVFGSWRAEPSTGSLGAGAAIGALSIDVVPTIEYVYVDNATDWAINVDAHFPVLALPIVALYMGGGVGTYWHDPKSGESTSDFGANILFGAKASIRRLKPFAEIRYTTAGPDGVVYMAGARFHLFD